MTCKSGKWYLGGVRIYVEKDSGWKVQPRRGEINVLDSNETIIHCAGRPSYTRNLTFVVVSGYENNILPLADVCSGVELCTDHGSAGNVTIKSISADRLQAINHPNPVYRVTIECIKDGP